MGQKVNPISMRLQVNKDWRSKWFANRRDYATYLAQDLKVRKIVQSKFGSRGAITRSTITESAIALALADLHEHGAQSAIFRSMVTSPTTPEVE